jgi:two-component system, NarL family, response regulator DegU
MTVVQNQQATIRVLLVEDHYLVRDGIRQHISLHDDLELIGEIADGGEALTAIPQLRPDVILMDIALPTLDGIHVVSHLGIKREETAVIMLTSHDDPTLILHAIRAGAAGFCTKSLEPDRLVQNIREVRQGNFVLESRVLTQTEIDDWVERTVRRMTGPYMEDLHDHYTPLSPRQMEILVEVTHGRSNQEIASALSISQQTVKNHMTEILKRLDVQDRTQAAVYAIQQGWVRMTPILTPNHRQSGME